MAKRGIHPQLKQVRYILTDGSSILLSAPSLPSRSGRALLENDKRSDPRWTGRSSQPQISANVARFRRRQRAYEDPSSQ